jgi:hypothetical protein
MIQQVLKQVIPIMLVQVQAVSVSDKRRYAQFLNALTAAYLENQKDDFEQLLNLANLPEQWKLSIMQALWSDTYVTDTRK